MGIVLFLFFGAVVVGMIALGMVQHRATIDNWRIAAREMGLVFNESTKWRKMEISGLMRGVHVRIYGEQRGSENQKHYTIYECTYPVAAGPPVTLRRESALSTIKRLVGVDDVQLGDPAFDDRVEIRSESPSAAKEFLTPARRMAALSLFENFPNAEISSSRLAVELQRVERSPQALTTTTRRLVDMALVMSAPAPVDAALELEAQGDIGAGADALAELNRAEPNLYTRLLEAEARVAMGERDSAASILDDVATALPRDREVEGWRRVAHTPPPPQADVRIRPPMPSVGQPRPAATAPPPPAAPRAPDPSSDPESEPEPESEPLVADTPEPAPAPAPTPTPPEPEIVRSAPDSEGRDSPPEPEPEPTATPPDPSNPLTGVTAAEIIEDLFASNRPSYEVEDHFTTVYRGAAVTWSGTVERVRDYRSDRDFGDSPGQKATITIGHLGDGQLVSDQIDAIVHLGPDVALERESTVTFTGTLLRVDRFMRNIYVANATLG